MTERPSIYDFTFEKLKQQLNDWDEPSYRAQQVWHGIYKRLAAEPRDMTNVPHNIQDRLAQTFVFSSIAEKAISQSGDGKTEKVLLGLADNNTIEAVLMRYRRRHTACISTQVGCAMGCVFCATGQMGLARNLSAGEIIEQVVILARKLAANGERLTNIVLMGMGEPFHNYDPTIEALDRLNHPKGANFGARRFTISTIGIVPMIKRFAHERRQMNLAVSLHAASNELRQKLLPINRRFPLETLIPTCREYVELTGRRISFEWALIHNTNDGFDQAEALVRLVNGLNCHVNLIPLNPTQGYPGEAAPMERGKHFREFLRANGIPCTIRLRRGIDIHAGCGQLATDRNATTKPASRSN